MPCVKPHIFPSNIKPKTLVWISTVYSGYHYTVYCHPIPKSSLQNPIWKGVASIVRYPCKGAWGGYCQKLILIDQIFSIWFPIRNAQMHSIRKASNVVVLLEWTAQIILIARCRCKEPIISSCACFGNPWYAVVMPFCLPEHHHHALWMKRRRWTRFWSQQAVATDWIVGQCGALGVTEATMQTLVLGCIGQVHVACVIAKISVQWSVGKFGYNSYGRRHK